MDVASSKKKKKIDYVRALKNLYTRRKQSEICRLI